MWWLNFSYQSKLNQSNKIKFTIYTLADMTFLFKDDSATLSPFPHMPLTALFLV